MRNLALLKMNFKPIFYIYLIIISFIAFYPKNAGVDVGGDKVNHLLAFVVFAILHYLSFKKRYLNIFISGLVFGVYIEFVQYFLPYRMADIFDVLVDLVGVIVGIGLMVLVKIRYNLNKSQVK